MGLILDSSVLIAADRKSGNVRQALSEIAVRAAGEDVACSVVTLVELPHGAARADTPERKTMRRLVPARVDDGPPRASGDDFGGSAGRTVLTLAALSMFLLALAASTIPAYRAGRIEPTEALRAD
jgi:hypothetical protein